MKRKIKEKPDSELTALEVFCKEKPRTPAEIVEFILKLINQNVVYFRALNDAGPKTKS